MSIVPFVFGCQSYLNYAVLHVDTILLLQAINTWYAYLNSVHFDFVVRH